MNLYSKLTRFISQEFLLSTRLNENALCCSLFPPSFFFFFLSFTVPLQSPCSCSTFFLYFFFFFFFFQFIIIIFFSSYLILLLFLFLPPSSPSPPLCFNTSIAFFYTNCCLKCVYLHKGLTRYLYVIVFITSRNSGKNKL